MGGSVAHAEDSFEDSNEDDSSKDSPKKESKTKTRSKREDADFRAQLIIDHREHGIRLAWSLLKRWRIRIEQDDVTSVVGAALVEAAHRFDDSRGVSFRTFFFYHLRGLLIKEITALLDEKKSFKSLPNDSLEQVVGNTDLPEGWPFQLVERRNPEALLEKRQFEEIFWNTCNELDSLEREVIVRHFVQDEPLKEIASDLDYCRCHISRVKSRALARLRKQLPMALEEESQELASHITQKRYTGGRGRRKTTLSTAKTARKKAAS